jgi:hypothetical protein
MPNLQGLKKSNIGYNCKKPEAERAFQGDGGGHSKFA